MNTRLCRIPLSIAFLLAPRAAAACTGIDFDGDGWCRPGPGHSNPPDCADFDASVNPAAAEDGLDTRDNDCDGTMLVHRSFVSSMAGAAGVTGPPSRLIALANGASLNTSGGDDRVDLPGGGALLKVNGAIPHPSGQFTAVFRVTAESGTPGCWLSVTSTSTGVSIPFSGVGTHTVPITGVMPGDSVTLVQLRCNGTGSSQIDWLTTSSGSYTWAPEEDLSTTWSTMGLPGVGRQSVLRSSVADDGGIGSLVFVGSDVGGLGWTEDGYAWYTANGLADEWVGDGDYGVW